MVISMVLDGLMGDKEHLAVGLTFKPLVEVFNETGQSGLASLLHRGFTDTASAGHVKGHLLIASDAFRELGTNDILLT